MTLPLASDPEAVAQLADWCVSLFPDASTPPLEPMIRFAGYIGSAAVLGAAVWCFARRASPQTHQIAETLGLAALFLFLHPLVSVGLYFLFWHSARHLIRLARAFEPERRARRRQLTRSGGLILATTAFLLLGAARIANPGDIPSMLGLVLVFICCITLPHTFLVDWLDRRQMASFSLVGK